MKRRRIFSISALLLILLVPAFIHAKSNYKYVHSPDTDIYFGHISYADIKNDGKDPVVIREGGIQVEVALMNLPLTAGDTIRTTDSRRCEIQFDTGTVIRLNYATELKIETIMARSLSSRRKLTNFVLKKGEIFIMYKKYNYPEIFQVITPNAAVKMKHRIVAWINVLEDGSTAVRVKYGKAEVKYGPDDKKLEERIVYKSETLTISKSQRALFGEYKPDVDFELWNETMNKNFEEMHEGESFLPKPIQRLSKAVYHFAQRYSNIYGEWIWDSLYGYVWRPYLNDRRYPWANWQPYYAGRWTDINGQLFWVPEEPWGWVPYHLGFWKWDEKRGWLWVPGSVFSPAWVTWYSYGGYYGWWPWSMWDWYTFSGYGFSGYPYWYLYGGYYPEWRYSGYVDSKRTWVHTVISKNELRQRTPSPRTLPREFRGISKNFLSALNRLDKRVLDSLPRMRGFMVVVKKEDLNAGSIRDVADDFRKFDFGQEKGLSPLQSGKNYSKDAVRAFRENRAMGRLSESTIKRILRQPYRHRTLPYEPVPLSNKKSVTARRKVTAQKVALPENGTGFRRTYGARTSVPVNPSRKFSMRFRDWNPDVKMASRIGVTIRYSSRTNEIRCPEFNFSSRDVRGARGLRTLRNISSSRRGYSSGSGGSYSSGSSGSSSSSSSSSGSRSSSSSRSSGSGSSRGGGSSKGSSGKK